MNGEIIPLGKEPPESPEPPVSRPKPLHGAAIAGMALSALVATVSLFLFVTIGWPEGTGRYVIVIFILAAIGFIASASVAVLTAARDTYATGRRNTGTATDK